ncbi:MAG: ATP-binding protein [Chitinophagales bacterium]|nr:ATP-binding protein [Bacteroidota bacterium]MCB9042224.1 ATP-binding protein [Chitinophagales bacterium]
MNIPSQPENINKMEVFLDNCLRDNKINRQQYHDILLVLTEAVTNCMLHGNGANPEKNVLIECKIESDHIRFWVEDEGAGFDPSHLPDPTQRDFLDKPCGRGVFLMRRLSHSMRFHHQGRAVEIEFRTNEHKDN